MSSADNKVRTELTSWKQIAEFLGVSVRTAQRYEETMALPIRRVGGEKSGAVSARPEELIAWRSKSVLSPRWWQNPRVLRIYSVAATVIILVLAFVVGRDLNRQFGVGKPHDSRWVSSTLVVVDARDREVWSKVFERAPRYDALVGRYHGDLDGDGRVKTLVPLITAEADSEGAFLYCYSEKGEELWRIQPKRAVSDRRDSFSTVYVLRSFAVFASPEKDGTRWVVATFVHHFRYPSVVVVVDSKGRLRGEYWHSGHLDSVYTRDLDNDGIDEILAAGSSVDSSRATLVVLDPRKVSGAQILPPEHPNQLQGFSPGAERAVVTFARARLNKLRGQFNFAYWVGPSTAEDRSFQVYVSENLDRAQGYLIYTLKPDLSLEAITPSMSLLNTYQEYSLTNPSSKPFGEADLEELQRGFTVVPGKSGPNSPEGSGTPIK